MPPLRPARPPALAAWRVAGVESAYRRAHELAEQIGWSEVCYDALYGLSGTLRDQGEIQGAQSALSQALDVCERAGLIVQSIQANSARALLHRLAGDDQRASEAAGEAVQLAERVRYPVGAAASIEAAGVVGPLPQALDDLRSARKAWMELQRPLEAARCELLLGQRLLERPRARSRIAGAGCAGVRAARRRPPGDTRSRARHRPLEACAGRPSPRGGPGGARCGGAT